MDNILKLHELVKPIIILAKENKGEIDRLVCDIEADAQIPDEEWDAVEAAGTSLEFMVSRFEKFREIV